MDICPRCRTPIARHPANECLDQLVATLTGYSLAHEFSPCDNLEGTFRLLTSMMARGIAFDISGEIPEARSGRRLEGMMEGKGEFRCTLFDIRISPGTGDEIKGQGFQHDEHRPRQLSSASAGTVPLAVCRAVLMAM